MGKVDLHDISLQFSGQIILNRFNLEVLEGEYLAIVGASGSGKSTVLSVIAGLTRPDSGTVALHGADAEKIPARLRDIAMVFQTDSLYPHMTVRQNILFGSPVTSSTADLKKRTARAVKMTRIGSLLDRRPGDLSGGEKNRVAIAKTIVRDASVRLLDEPLAAIDAAHRQCLLDDLRQIHDATRGITIHVTHDGLEAMQVADRVAVLHEGRIVQIGTPENVYRQPTDPIVARLVAPFPVNEFRVNQVDSQTFHAEPLAEPIDASGDETLDDDDQSDSGPSTECSSRGATVRSEAIELQHFNASEEDRSSAATFRCVENAWVGRGTVVGTRFVGIGVITTVRCGDVLLRTMADGDPSFGVGDSVTIHIAREQLLRW